MEWQLAAGAQTNGKAWKGKALFGVAQRYTAGMARSGELWTGMFWYSRFGRQF